MRIASTWLLFALALAAPRASTAATFKVTVTDDGTDLAPGDGVCATVGGVCTLRAAIQEANAVPGADEIDLPAGTFALTFAGRGEDAAATGDLDILDDLTLRGAGNRKTVIDGRQSDRVLQVAPHVTVVMSAFAVQNGDARGAGDGDGGGLLFGSAVDGGAMLVMDNVVFSGNAAQGLGGGLANYGQARLNKVTVADNSAGDGGGIFNGGNIVLSGGGWSGNRAADSGGGLDNTGIAALANVDISDNVAAHRPGGGVFNEGVFTAQATTLSGNAGAVKGGGVYSEGTLTLTNVTLSENSATHIAGSTSEGGGIDNLGTATLLNVTLFGNAAQEGGGLYNHSDFGAMELINTIVAGSTAGGDCFERDVVTSLGHNLDSDGSCQFTAGGDLSHADPQLGALQDNGGATFTRAPATSSPAVDAGDPANCPERDQRGQMRPADGNGDGKIQCDVGAVEIQPLASSGGGGCSLCGAAQQPPSAPAWLALTALLALRRGRLSGRSTRHQRSEG